MVEEAGGLGTCPLNKASNPFAAQPLRFSSGLLCKQHGHSVEQDQGSVSVSAATNGACWRREGGNAGQH